MFVTKEYRKGKAIIRQGTHGTSAFILKKGRVEVSRVDENGKKQVITILNENDLFGEMAMVSSKPRTASVIALEECEVAILTRERFLALPDTNPAVLRIKKIMKDRIKK